MQPMQDELVRRLDLAARRATKRCGESLNNGGCGVFAALIASAVRAAMPDVEVYGRIASWANVDVEMARPHVSDIADMESWNENGVYFAHVGLDYRDSVVQDVRFVRPAEVDLLVGDPSKARERLGWRPTVDFATLVRTMVEADL